MGLLVASDDVGADEERFDWFCKTVNDEVMPVMLSTRHPDAFRASITDLDLGVVRLTAVACSPVDSRRTATHVRRGDPEHVQLALLSQGALVISQRGNESAVTGGLVLTDTSRPSEGACTRSVWLDGDPIETDAEACTSRSIYLASGWYTWTQIFGAARTPSRDLYLAAGTYTWTDCIKPHSGSYEQKSSLYRPGYQPAYLNDPKFTATRATYTFGSELDPHF
ncbi:hypothetical protein AB0C77_18910 [Streptomyces sp. NPDC048629]|uniref:AraC-like ligand-binding domain-containing protein n=1 Tax=Streptomyces sp. NPDC048629 TaxID=3154824 RepID=UPI0034360ED4